MTTVTTRQTSATGAVNKNGPLTNSELDLNFVNLNLNKVEDFEVANFPQLRPTLLLDFVNSKVLDPRITFARNSVASYYDSLGILRTASADQARFNHDPVTGESLGLLMEEQRTNLVLRSEEFDNAYWGKIQMNSTSTNAGAAPDGLLAADGMIANTVSGGHYYERNETGLPTSTNYCCSIFVKQGNCRDIFLRVFGTGNAMHGVTLNFSTGIATFSSSAEYVSGLGVTTSWGAQLVGNGWWRVWVAGYPDNAATNRRFRIQLTDGTGNGTFAGDGTTINHYVWGAQLEAGDLPSSYIPTTTAAVTRFNDSAIMGGTNFASWFNQTEGTLLADAITSLVYAGTNKFPGVVQIDDTTNDNRHFLLLRVLSPYTDSTYGAFTGAVSQASYDTNEQDGNSVMAFAYKTNDIAFVVAGELEYTDTMATIPTVNRIVMGTIPNSLNGHLRKLAYYPVRLSNAELQALTL